MPAKGKHRRPKQNPIARRLALAGTGGAALALPLISATTAGAVETTKAPATYSVVAGDSLSKIAAEHSLTGGWQQLYAANKTVVGGNPSVIRPGLTLKLGTAAKAAAAAKTTSAAKPATAYPNNLDGWIRESLDVMARHGIPGTYNGIHRNIMRESSGNPMAINNWDSNAAAGIPSKGLLQVIDPTFKAYHVPGTSMDSYDPVANITAACNYAAARYGSIDNVNGPY
ncbi:LysM peptidoglycan-binding domain-containing protein [Streptomyces sp. RerS4]|uniref:transglycosylase SLT domain-containing protein n=1 Tax=Streptomyces sp. RerS4 TaxID=2942449 RepID=UPI00201C7FDC|nr:LysM peptidoglycan-binding domain-containing protein [Streptomyces sp. RerS4]UQX04286.1 LysM peptidoglycan-binding domain-containing protein [Streptomyces sp. RerS4]